MPTSGWGTIPWGQGPWGSGEDDPDSIVVLPRISKQSRVAVGSVARIWLDIISGGVGLTGLSPTLSIRRSIDDQWFNPTDETWGLFDGAIAMVEADSSMFPGRYYYDFDTNLDPEESSLFVAYGFNYEPRIESSEKIFVGPDSARVSPRVCDVLGTVSDENLQPIEYAEVSASLVPVYKDSGRAVQSWVPAIVHTDDVGFFSLPLVRDGTYRIEIPSIEYDRVVVVPDEDQVNFTQL